MNENRNGFVKRKIKDSVLSSQRFKMSSRESMEERLKRSRTQSKYAKTETF